MLLAIVLLMLLLTGAVGVGGRYLVAAQRAASAADLAALAGAQAHGSGEDGCAAAAALAAENNHQVEDCDTVGDRLDFVLTIQVVAVMPTPLPPLPEEVTATAHAGPVR